MATTSPGRSREELNAAAAALTAAMHEVDDAGDAAMLAERARQFEDEAMDAAPLAATGEVSDEQLLAVIATGITAGVTCLLVTSSGDEVPASVTIAVSRRVTSRALSSVLARHELIEGARNILAGRCVCGCGKPRREQSS